MTENRGLSRNVALPLVLLAAGGIFALTMGARQSMGLFLNTLNTATGLGLASISLAFAFGQIWWGLTQPFAGMVADRIGTRTSASRTGGTSSGRSVRSRSTTSSSWTGVGRRSTTRRGWLRP